MRRPAGFTLIELLVAVAVLAIFIVGILNLFDTSQQVAKTETALADTQENVRYAAYHLLRTARMAGGTAMPFAHDEGGADVWVAGRLQNNVSSFTDEFDSTNVATTPGSDVVTLRGFFERSPYFVNPTRSPSPDVDWSASPPTVTVHQNVGAANDLSVVEDELLGRGIVLMGRSQYAVSVVTGNSAPFDSGGEQVVTVEFAANPGAPWSTFNPTGAWVAPTFPVYRVGILDSYTYYVAPDFRLMRIRPGTTAGTSVDEPVAINIGNLQCSLGVDGVDADTLIDAWHDSPTVADVSGDNTPVALEVTVLGRTRERVPGWNEPPTTFQVRDIGANLTSVVDVNAKWRRMQVTATLRDFVL